MDVADLRVFETVARLGGMNRAAAELNTVQSNVTARIRVLEDELGEPLFQRHSRGTALTPAGARLLPYASRIARLIEEARRAVKDNGEPKGPLNIGSLETTAMQRLAPIIAEFGAAYPLVELALTIGMNDLLCEQVLRQRLDGAFVCGPIANPELVHDVVFREELLLATGPAVKNFNEFARSPNFKIVVKPTGCQYRKRLEEFLIEEGAANFGRLEFGSVAAIIGCIASGLGATLLPRSVLQPAALSGQIALHPMPKGKAEAEIWFIRRNDAVASSALKGFLASMLQLSVDTIAAE